VWVVDFLGDHRLQLSPGFPTGQHPVRLVGLGPAQVIVEQLPQHLPALSGVAEEVGELEQAGVISALQPAGSPEGWDAAFHRDPGAGKGGEVAGGADEGGGFLDEILSVRRGMALRHGYGIVLGSGHARQPACVKRRQLDSAVSRTQCLRRAILCATVNNRKGVRGELKMLLLVVVVSNPALQGGSDLTPEWALALVV
jgi:hypothetical protein